MVVEQKREKSVVYVLGAGATKAVNSRAPLMADLLPEALRLFEQRLQQPQPPGADRACRIKAFIDDFYQLRRDKLPRLEDVLTQLDLAIEEGRPLSKHYNISFLRNLREDLGFVKKQLSMYDRRLSPVRK